MIFLPLVYPELFERFRIAPPRGVLFYGPPGTGEPPGRGRGHCCCLHQLPARARLTAYQSDLAPHPGAMRTPEPSAGKTLVARALAAHASRGAGRKVSFFMRKVGSAAASVTAAILSSRNPATLFHVQP